MPVHQPHAIASAKRLVLVIQQEIIYTTQNNADGAIPKIHVAYFWPGGSKTAINYYSAIRFSGRMEE